MDGQHHASSIIYQATVLRQDNKDEKCNSLCTECFSRTDFICFNILLFTIQISCFGITHDGVLSGKLSAQRFQVLIYLLVFIELFHKVLSSIIRKKYRFKKQFCKCIQTHQLLKSLCILLSIYLTSIYCSVCDRCVTLK